MRGSILGAWVLAGLLTGSAASAEQLSVSASYAVATDAQGNKRVALSSVTIQGTEIPCKVLHASGGLKPLCASLDGFRFEGQLGMNPTEALEGKQSFARILGDVSGIEYTDLHHQGFPLSPLVECRVPTLSRLAQLGGKATEPCKPAFSGPLPKIKLTH